ncbi:MAG: hypothetical protein H0U13_12075 [Gemmatimonadaceae bacterium]|nr:hypothetical protein [Gemmatimonadaceae bacterium]
MPHSSVSIHDAANYLTACMPSGALITDAAVYEQVKTFVDAAVYEQVKTFVR